MKQPSFDQEQSGHSYFFVGFQKNNNSPDSFAILLLKIRYYLYKIWPSIYKFVNGFFYYVIKVLKAFIRYVRKQIGV